MTILVTGFGPFGEVTDNPSARIAKALGQEGDVYARVLDVSYTRAARRLCQLIEQVQPQFVLSFGVGRRRKGMELERIAHNLNDCTLPDIDGDVRIKRPIAAGFETLSPALDVDAIAARLGLAVSDDAGGYVCNHLYFEGLRHLRATPAKGRMIFAHIPPEGDYLPQAMALLKVLRSL